MEFVSNIDERAGKINMVMDAYLNSPEAQKSEIMKNNIAYIMSRAGDASIESVKQAVAVILDSSLCNDKDKVDELLYNMNPFSDYCNILNQPKELRERIENASKEIDKFSTIRHSKACFKATHDLNLNATNLPLVEKFLANPEFTQNNCWIAEIDKIIAGINFTLKYHGEKAANMEAMLYMGVMNDYLNDKEAQKDPDIAAKKYFDKCFQISIL